ARRRPHPPPPPRHVRARSARRGRLRRRTEAQRAQLHRQVLPVPRQLARGDDNHGEADHAARFYRVPGRDHALVDPGRALSLLGLDPLPPVHSGRRVRHLLCPAGPHLPEAGLRALDHGARAPVLVRLPDLPGGRVWIRHLCPHLLHGTHYLRVRRQLCRHLRPGPLSDPDPPGERQPVRAVQGPLARRRRDHGLGHGLRDCERVPDHGALHRAADDPEEVQGGKQRAEGNQGGGGRQGRRGPRGAEGQDHPGVQRPHRRPRRGHQAHLQVRLRAHARRRAGAQGRGPDHPRGPGPRGDAGGLVDGDQRADGADGAVPGELHLEYYGSCLEWRALALRTCGPAEDRTAARDRAASPASDPPRRPPAHGRPLSRCPPFTASRLSCWDQSHRGGGSLIPRPWRAVVLGGGSNSANSPRQPRSFSPHYRPGAIKDSRWVPGRVVAGGRSRERGTGGRPVVTRPEAMLGPPKPRSTPGAAGTGCAG
ncbi:hypothetical protein DFJ74DRAFT_121897, partial [Hyaloraphidium curvatum]